MRALSDYIVKEFAALGLPTISDHQLIGSKQAITFSDGTRVFVGAFASDSEIQTAVRGAFHMTDQPEASADATPLPVVEMDKPEQKAPARIGKPIPAAGDYKPGSIGELLRGLKARKQEVMGTVAKEAKRAHKALDLAAQTGADLHATTESILDEFREFTNEIPDLDTE